jgi:hypothetical protein
MTKTFDIEITKRQTLILKVQLCEPYPVGDVSASAQPVLTRDFRWYLTSESPGVPATYQDYRALTPLIQSSVAANGLVTFSYLPATVLQSSFDTSTGLITVFFPFGNTYREPPSFEVDEGASPRTYSYYVTLGQLTLVEGYVRMSKALATVDSGLPGAGACQISSEYAPTDGSLPETSAPSGGPWLAGV